MRFVSLNGSGYGWYRILIWPDIPPPDIRPIILPDTEYPAGWISFYLDKDQNQNVLDAQNLY